MPVKESGHSCSGWNSCGEVRRRTRRNVYTISSAAPEVHQRKRTACSSNARSANKAVARITNEQRIENARFFRGPILFFLATLVRAPFEFIINMDTIVNKREFTNLFAQFFGAAVTTTQPQSGCA